MDEFHPRGVLVVADLCGLPGELLRDGDRLVGIFRNALAEAGMHIVRGPLVYAFEQAGKGVTAAFLLRESHATFHTYPEAGCLMLDIYACGGADPDRVVDRIANELRPGNIARTSLPRGSGPAARPGRRSESPRNRP